MPDWPSEIRAAIAKLELDPAREASLVEELSQHLADRYNELRGEGVEDAEACRLLRAELNDGTLVAELGSMLSPSPEAAAPGLDERERFFAGVGRDLRQALRLLRLNPGFAAVAILSLALGIGANTAIFELLDAVSAAHAARAVATATRRYPGDSRRTDRKHGRAAKGILLRHLGAVAATAEGLLRHCGVEHGAVRPGTRWRGALRARDVGERQLLRGAAGAADAGPADRRERRLPGCGVRGVVISNAFWQRDFGSRSNVVGSKLSLDGHPFEIIGVTPPSFYGLEVGRNFDVAVPLCSEPVLHGQGAWTKSRRRGGWRRLGG